MAISITTAEVKRKAGIDSAVTTFDTAIGALISEMQGPIEYSIADIYLADTNNQKLQATLKLGMLEIIQVSAFNNSDARPAPPSNSPSPG